MKYNTDMIYNEKTKKWYKPSGGSGWVLMDECENCGEKYFTRCDKISKFCSRSCKMSGERNHMFGKTHTPEVREMLKQNIKKTFKTIKERYGIDNISCLDSVKIKKGQQILDFNYISNYVSSFGFTLLSKDDKQNNETVLTLVCPNNHVFNMKYLNFKANHRCSQCFYDSLRKNWTEEDLLSFQKYKKYVLSLSKQTYIKYHHIINPQKMIRGNGINEYHVDHKYSIIEGFNNNVDPHIISSYINLEMLPSRKNMSKQGRCSISLDELYALYNNINNNI